MTVLTLRSSTKRTSVQPLQAELSSSPVSSLGVVSDGVASSHSDPLRNRAVLLDLLTKRTLELETLDSSLKRESGQLKTERNLVINSLLGLKQQVNEYAASVYPRECDAEDHSSFAHTCVS